MTTEQQLAVGFKQMFPWLYVPADCDRCHECRPIGRIDTFAGTQSVICRACVATAEIETLERRIVTLRAVVSRHTKEPTG